MNLANFTDQQKQSLLDLLVAGMYADGKLASIEDAKIQGLLDTIKFSSGDARNQFMNASITRARKHAGSPESVRAFVADIAKSFAAPDLRRQAYDALADVLASDKEVAEKESQLLAVVKAEFKL
jgi:uncharacterized tellurite resistance protein B-like protein